MLARRSQGETSDRMIVSCLSLPKELAEALDVWIARQPRPRPSRPEAICQILQTSLQSNWTLADFST